MPDGEKNYWLKETYRHLTLAAIGAQGKSREHIEKAVGCLEKHEKEVEVLRKSIEFPKNVIFHYCKGATIKPYPRILCSLCHSKHNSKDFNVFKEIKILQEKAWKYDELCK